MQLRVLAVRLEPLNVKGLHVQYTLDVWPEGLIVELSIRSLIDDFDVFLCSSWLKSTPKQTQAARGILSFFRIHFKRSIIRSRQKRCFLVSLRRPYCQIWVSWSQADFRQTCWRSWLLLFWLKLKLFLIRNGIIFYPSKNDKWLHLLVLFAHGLYKIFLCLLFLLLFSLKLVWVHSRREQIGTTIIYFRVLRLLITLNKTSFVCFFF